MRPTPIEVMHPYAPSVTFAVDPATPVTSSRPGWNVSVKTVGASDAGGAVGVIGGDVGAADGRCVIWLGDAVGVDVAGVADGANDGVVRLGAVVGVDVAGVADGAAEDRCVVRLGAVVGVGVAGVADGAAVECRVGVSVGDGDVSTAAAASVRADTSLTQADVWRSHPSSSKQACQPAWLAPELTRNSPATLRSQRRTAGLNSKPTQPGSSRQSCLHSRMVPMLLLRWPDR